MKGKYTLEIFAKESKIKETSAINKLSKLKKQGLVQVSGGGRQKRIYTISEFPKKQSNGFYAIVNKYSPEKLVPAFEHQVFGRYTVENALIDGLKMEGARIRDAIIHLFRHVNDWKKLFKLARKSGKEENLIKLYKYARTKTKCKRMPEGYLNDKY